MRKELTKALNGIVKAYSGTKKNVKRIYFAKSEKTALISDGCSIYKLSNSDFDYVVAKLKNVEVGEMLRLQDMWKDMTKKSTVGASVVGNFKLEKDNLVYIRNGKVDVVVNNKYFAVVQNPLSVDISESKSPIVVYNDDIESVILPISHKYSRKELESLCAPEEVAEVVEAEPVAVEEKKAAEPKNIDEVVFPTDCRVQKRGCNLWIDGNTKPIKAMLKELGFRYAPKCKKAVPERSAWYKVITA